MEKVFTWTTPAGAIRAEAAHWRSVSVEDRVSAVELLREATPGIYGEVPARLERVYRFVELTASGPSSSGELEEP